MAYQALTYENTDGIARITFSRPDSLNALDPTLATEVRLALEEARGDPSIRVLILTGTGRGFSAGGDVATFHAHVDTAPAFLRELLMHFHTGITTILELPFPVVAGINGVTAGAGMGYCMAADLAVAAESAVFTMAYTGIGATPDGSTTYFLPRIVGTRRAMEMTLLNRTLSAREALDWGLVNEVVADAELGDAVQALAERLRNGPTRALGNARRLIRESFNTQLATQLENEGNSIAAMGATDDFREGVTAFVEKRKPAFTGR
jgi:2-(1,2-epoxy-1,2-dihydrophenyl)acetyl-CoA isomerase